MILQSVIFIRNADIFEIRPRKTKEYFVSLEKILAKDGVLLDLPLPSYINQGYRISDLAPVINGKSKIIYFNLQGDYCSENLKKSFNDPDIIKFYNEQVNDPVVVKEFNKITFLSCLSQSHKRL